MTEGDNDWPAVAGNLVKARKIWGMTGEGLTFWEKKR